MVDAKLWAPVVVVVVAVTSAGCRTPCDEIASARDAFLEQQVERGSSPHAVATIPLEMANELIEPQVAAMAPLPLEVPGAGLLGPFLTGLAARPRRATLSPAAASGVALEVELEVVQRETVLFTMTAEGVIQPTFDRERRLAVIELQASDFHRMTPRLDENAAAHLAERLHRSLPQMARMMISTRQLAAGAALVTETVLTQSYPMIRDRLLSQLGPLARLEVSLPELPIEALEVETVPAGDSGFLRLAMQTALPVSRGVDHLPTSAPEGRAAGLVLSGQTVAALANWAMAQGQLPRRFDEAGRPDPEGVFEAGLRWGEGERPLKVHVWQLEGRCLHAVLGAEPLLRTEDEQIVLELDEVRVEELEGPPLAGLARLFSGIWLRAMRRTQSTAGALEFVVGGQPMRGQVIDIARSGDLVALELSLTPVSSPVEHPTPSAL